MSTESVDGHATHFRIFARDVVQFDQRLHVIAQSFFSRAFSRALSGDGGQVCSFGAPARGQTLKFGATTARFAFSGGCTLLIFRRAFGGHDFDLREEQCG
jgi:hypothetical protein